MIKWTGVADGIGYSTNEYVASLVQEKKEVDEPRLRQLDEVEKMSKYGGER